MKLEGLKYHVEYVLTRDWVGGGPSYVIDARTGEILHKAYYQ